ncbi:MAG: hypothetical protein Q4D14_02325 [Bacteroidales bacterium]|nr:hypothetical protein [Bacteroidales bacterium]
MTKKLFVVLSFMLCGVAMVCAQPRAIGLRLIGDWEVSYQHQFGEKNMLEIEAGVPVIFSRFGGLHAAATYDWIFPITSWTEKGSWNWYAGVGGAVGANYYKYKANQDHPADVDGHYCFFLGVAGRIGVEYNFWFPLQLSLDYRPVIGPAFGHGFHEYGLTSIALSVRYKF